MKKLLLLLLLLGMAVRITVFFQNRSLFLDEANLARNIVEKPIQAFFSPLDYEQYAPPFFLMLEKGFTQIFGTNELALRLFPLLVGLLGLFLFYRILLHEFKWPPWLWFPLFLLCFSPGMIRYSSEIKQYTVDVSVGIGLLWLALKTRPEKWTLAAMVKWAGIGILSIWLSMPSVFMLSGVGFYFLQKSYKDKSLSYSWQTLAVILMWLISFFIFYSQIVRPSLETNLLVDYHSTYFFPLLPTTAADWSKAGNIILQLFRMPFGYTAFAYMLGISSFLLGSYALCKQHFATFLLFAVPILFCFIASGLGYYSLMPRLSLFLVPLVLLISSWGIHWLWQKNGIQANKWIRHGLIILFIMVAAGKEGYHFFYKKLEIEEIRPIVEQVANEAQSADLIYLHNEAAPAFLFYQKLKVPPIAFPQVKIHSANWDETPSDILGQPNDYRQVWLLFSHLVSDHARKIRDQNLEAMPGNYYLKKKIESTGAAAYLFAPSEK